MHSKPAVVAHQTHAAPPRAERAEAPQALISPPEALRRLSAAWKAVHPGSGSGACVGRTGASGWCPGAAADPNAGLAGGPQQALVSPGEALRRLQAVVSVYYPQELVAGADRPDAAAAHEPNGPAARPVRPRPGWMQRKLLSVYWPVSHCLCAGACTKFAGTRQRH